jgi:hypothetical protein
MPLLTNYWRKGRKFFWTWHPNCLSHSLMNWKTYWQKIATEESKCFWRKLLLVTILIHFSLLHILTIYFPTISANIILPFPSRCYKLPHCKRFPRHICVCICCFLRPNHVSSPFKSSWFNCRSIRQFMTFLRIRVFSVILKRESYFETVCMNLTWLSRCEDRARRRLVCLYLQLFSHSYSKRMTACDCSCARASSLVRNWKRYSRCHLYTRCRPKQVKNLGDSDPSPILDVSWAQTWLSSG